MAAGEDVRDVAADKRHARADAGDGAAPPDVERSLTGWRAALTFALLVLVGINLRSVLLSVPPIVPEIQLDLGLSYTLTGFLTALPILVFAAFALPSGLLAGRLGARRMVAVGLALLAAGALLRAAWPDALALFVFTFILSVGTALAQTSAPVLTRQWFPARVGLAAALFSDGLILGETIAAGATSPIAQQLGPHAWATTFVLWGLPVVAMLLLWLLLAPPARALVPSHRAPRSDQAVTRILAPVAEKPASASQRPRVRAWHLGIVLGCGSLIYFAMNGWIAAYNQAEGRAAQTAITLAVLNAAQLPSSLIVTLFAQRLAGQRWPFVFGGVVCLAALAGWLWSPASLEPLWAALLGGGSALVFVLGIALPPLLAGPREVARLTGTTLTLSYGVAFLGPLVGGRLWDLFGVPALAFAPVAAAGVTLILLGSALPSRERFGLQQHPLRGRRRKWPPSEMIVLEP